MKIFILSILFVCIGMIKGNCQYSIKVYEEGEKVERPSGTLAQNDILLVCKIAPKYPIQVSVNKANWRNRMINYHSTFEISLDDDVAYFYVRICDNGPQVTCQTYRLKPGRKYALIKEESSNVKIIAGRD